MSAKGSVAAFLSALPEEKRKVLSTVRDTIKKNLPAGYEEVVQGKLIAYIVPLALTGKTYNGHPLWYAALASQKNYFTLHLMSAYANETSLQHLQTGFKKAGKRLDMGKACIRFKKLEDLPLDVIAESVSRVPVEEYVRVYHASRRK